MSGCHGLSREGYRPAEASIGHGFVSESVIWLSMETPDRGAASPGPLGPIRRALLVIAGVLAAMLSIAAGGSIVLLNRLDASVKRDPTVRVEPEQPEKPINVLVLGSDSLAGLSAEERKKLRISPREGERSDTIILATFDPRRGKAVLVHFPRDLRVDIPGHGLARINEAFRIGGADLTRHTIRQFTGLPIHHYVKVDFSGFLNLVDALGGVKLCVDRPMYDERAGLRIPRAGCYTFDGKRALAFVRARHVEGDLIPDFSRISRQQQFIRAVLNKLLSVSSLVRIPQIVRLASANVTTDEGLSAADILYLADRLRDVASRDPGGARSVDLRVVPSVPQEIDGVSYVVAEQPEARSLFRALREGRPLRRLGTFQPLTRISPGVIRVRVLSIGSGEAATEAESLLRRAGFIVLPGRAAPPSLDAPAILYRTRAEERAETVSGFFRRLPVRPGRPSLFSGEDVIVVVGTAPEVAP
jgi:LCP family protein required for cell wall assembly